MKESFPSAALDARCSRARRLALLPSLVPLAIGALVVSVELGDPTVAQRYFIALAILTAWVAYLPLRLLLDKRGFGPWNSCDSWVAAFAFTTILSVVLSPDKSVSLHAALPVLILLSYYFLLSEMMKSVRGYPQIFILLALTAAVVASVGILQYFGIDLLPYTAERSNVKQVVLSTMGNPNFVASYIVPIMFIIPAVLFSIRRFGRSRIFIVIGVFLEFLLLVCLVMTGARGGWLAFVLIVSGLAALHILAHGRAPLGFGAVRISWKYALAFVAAIMLLIALLLIPNPLIKSRFDLAKRLTSTKEIRTRFFYWAVAGEMFARKPVLGVGYHRFSSSFWDEVVDMQKNDPRNLLYREYLLRVPNRMPGEVHNEFIEIAVEQGMLGLAAFLGMLAWFFVQAGGVIASARASLRTRVRTLYLLSALLAILIDGLFGFPLQLPASALLFWTLLALLRQNISRSSIGSQANDFLTM